MTTYLYRVSAGGAQVATWGGDATATTPVLSEPSFSAEVDGGLGPMEVRVARSFDDTGADLQVGNTVQTYAVRDGAIPLLIHAGSIERITRSLGPDGDEVSVTVHPWVQQLSNDIYRDDTISSTTVATTWTTTEIATILTYIVARANQRAGTFARVTTSSTSVQTSGKTVSIQVGSETYRSAIERVKKLGPGNFYWHVDAAGTFSYRSYDSGTRHDLTVGKDVLTVQQEENLSEARNTVYFWNQSDADGTVVAFERPAAETTLQSTYGRRAEIITDSRIDDQATATNVADAYLLEHQDAAKTWEVEVLASSQDGRGYPIETFHPGDTVALRGTALLDGLLLSVLRVDYRPDGATLTLGVGPARRPATLGMDIESMATFLRSSTDGSIPTVTT